MEAPGHYAARILDRLVGDPRPVVYWRDTVISTVDLRDAVLRVAAALRGLGAGQGTTVAVLTEVNSPWMLVVRYAVHLLGATVVYVSGANHGTTTHGLSTETRARMLGECGATVLVHDEPEREEAERVHAVLAEPVGLCGLGEPVSGEVTAAGEPVSAPLTEFILERPGHAMVIYTSGSTGRPKGVRKPFAAWNNVVMAESGEQPKNFLAVSAVSHTGGLLVDVAVASGGSVLLRSGFDPAAFLRDIELHRITDTLIGVPQFYELVNHPDVRRTDLTSLRRLLYVGCPASPELIKEAVQVFPGVLNHSYGTTETGRIAMLTAADHDVPELLATVGRPMPNLEVVILDPDTGRELPTGETGEVVVRSPLSMDGYVADPELTEKVLRDGWVHTRDYGSLDEHGYLRLFGRMNDMVKVHDTKVHPSEVEKVLVGHRGVVDAYVYPHRRANLVEELHAAVVLRADETPDFAALREHVAGHMTPTHAPTRFVRWQEFPVNSNGKVDRRSVRERSLNADERDGEAIVRDHR
ncbi:AMP-dependent synthetase [Streptacidiphilus pinicola]|uniref:AMP-dependent synthetase n=1 Tax=Streptacidiphilus pinicola TaxID=2219663 RepID=A0A2X0JZ73_9ACTN|nr:AMP-dependent synthetase [Streptacidiphilus pinicola]